MLEFLKVRNPDQIKQVIQLYNPLKDSWIVSDLKSKQEIQDEAIRRNGFYTDEAILRISDFWRLWIRRIEPALQVVSSDFIKSLVQNFVDIYGGRLEIIDTEVTTLNKALQEFAPILLHPTSNDLLEEWMVVQASEVTPEKKWRRWYQLAKVCINYIVYEKKAIDAKWCAAYLQTLDLNFLVWDRKIYVDLGSELTSVEMGLLKHISQTQDVVIITPTPQTASQSTFLWQEKFPYLLGTYRENFGYGSVRDWTDSSVKNVVRELADNLTAKSYTVKKEQFIRLSNQLAEVKFVVSTIRKWAETGVNLDKIAVISADIEKYWPVLQFYLEEEGLCYKKDLVAPLNSLGDVQNLLAALKNISQDVAWDSLEKNLFSKTDFVDPTTGVGAFRFEKFKALFYQLYDEDDLNRDEKIKNLFYRKVDFNADFDRDEFLAYLTKIWIHISPHKSVLVGIIDNVKDNKLYSTSDIFELICKDFLAHSLNIKIKFRRWVEFLKNRLGHKEVTINKGNSTGLYVLPLMSAQMIEVSHRIYIGLNEEYYHKKKNPIIPPGDSVVLKTQFDLAVENSEESYLDFNLRWQSLACSENTLFTSPHLSFISEPMNACLFFIENSPQSELVIPGSTRVDELQKQVSYLSTSPAGGLSDNRFGLQEIQAFNTSISAKRLVQDITGYTGTVESEVFRQLTISDIENYAQCSFKLLAAKGFRLRELPQVALDLDPRQKGSLVHSLFEYCINLMAQNTYDAEKTFELCSAFLDKKRIEYNIYYQQEAHWKIQKNKFLQLVKKFYQFELSRIKNFSIKTEETIEIFFDLEKREFNLSKPENRLENKPANQLTNGFSFKIRLDRIDTHKTKKYSIIYDYKSSAYQASNFRSWLTEQQFQMLLYMIALELTFGEKEDADVNSVKGAIYYQYKTFDLKKGIIDEDIAMEDFALTKRHKSLISNEKKIELKEDFIAKIAGILQRLNEYRFDTLPSDIDICKKCDWRKLCRATHLM